MIGGDDEVVLLRHERRHQLEPAFGDGKAPEHGAGGVGISLFVEPEELVAEFVTNGDVADEEGGAEVLGEPERLARVLASEQFHDFERLAGGELRPEMGVADEAAGFAEHRGGIALADGEFLDGGDVEEQVGRGEFEEAEIDDGGDGIGEVEAIAEVAGEGAL